MKHVCRRDYYTAFPECMCRAWPSSAVTADKSEAGDASAAKVMSEGSIASASDWYKKMRKVLNHVRISLPIVWM